MSIYHVIMIITVLPLGVQLVVGACMMQMNKTELQYRWAHGTIYKF